MIVSGAITAPGPAIVTQAQSRADTPANRGKTRLADDPIGLLKRPIAAAGEDKDGDALLQSPARMDALPRRQAA
jgi:hypothetical protein